MTAAQMLQHLGGSHGGEGLFRDIASFLPHKTLSQGGFDAVVGTLEQGAKYSQDLDAFRRNWVQGHGGSIDGMKAAFDQQFPPESYASRVEPLPIPKSADAAKPNVIYQTARGPALWDGHQFIKGVQ